MCQTPTRSRGGPVYVSNDPDRDRRVPEDYEDVRAALFEQRFVGRIADWSRRRGLVFRLQAHGGYGDYLDVYALADVPESEALFAGGRFDFLKLASSAAHVADRRWASSESFITLRLWGTRLDRDEMRLLGGRAYSAGLNRLVFHGVPYPYVRADGEPWFPFSGGFGRILAGPLPMSSNFDAALLEQLPDFNRLLARLSVAMGSGEPAADVAWLRSDPSHPDTASFQVGRIDAHAGESSETRALRARGLVHDRVSRKMLAGARVEDGLLAVGAGRYTALLLDPLESAQPELAETLAAIAGSGIPVLALGALPQRSPGLRDAGARDGRVRAATERLRGHVIHVPSPEDLESLLARHLTGGLVAPPVGGRLEVSLDRRTSDDGETLLVFNESWSRHRAGLRFLRGGGPLTRWDPRTGSREVVRARVAPGDVVTIDLEAVETLLLTLGSTGDAAQVPSQTRSRAD